MKTVPVKMPGGIREMSEEQAEAYGRKQMSDRALIVELQERVAHLEKAMAAVLHGFKPLEL